MSSPTTSRFPGLALKSKEGFRGFFDPRQVRLMSSIPNIPAAQPPIQRLHTPIGSATPCLHQIPDGKRYRT